MPRSIFGWNLPPGCTASDIERAAGCGEPPPLKRCICGAWLRNVENRCEDIKNLGHPCHFGMKCSAPMGSPREPGLEYLPAKEVCEKCEKVEGYGGIKRYYVCRRCGKTTEVLDYWRTYHGR